MNLLEWYRAEQISKQPRAYVYHNFLSSEECDHIVALAKPQVKTADAMNLLSQASQRRHAAVSHADEKEHSCGQGRGEHTGQYKD